MLQLLRTAARRKLTGVAVLRLDFNAQDDWRMRSDVLTIRMLLGTAEKIVILSHRGRPAVRMVRGMPRGADARRYSLRRDAARLAKLIRKPVRFIGHFDFSRIKKEIAASPKGSVFLLENVRFLPGETVNARATGKLLAGLGDYYVNDAFAVDHRTSASLVAITKFIPGYAGLNLESEIKALSRVMRHPRKPLLVILGGGKASDKLGVIANLKKSASTFLVGGAAANTMLFVAGVRVGGSLYEKHASIQKALKPLLRDQRLMLPIDWEVSRNAIFDIGPATRKMFVREIMAARTIVWSGPMGKFEDPRFAEGSRAVARAIHRNKKAFSIVGGGETVMFLKRYGLERGFSFVSTGGGAMLDFLAGEKLPGIQALVHA